MAEKFSEYRKEAKIKVKFFNPHSLEAEEREMYIDGFKTSLIKGYVLQRPVESFIYAERILMGGVYLCMR